MYFIVFRQQWCLLRPPSLREMIVSTFLGMINENQNSTRAQIFVTSLRLWEGIGFAHVCRIFSFLKAHVHTASWDPKLTSHFDDERISPIRPWDEGRL